MTTDRVLAAQVHDETTLEYWFNWGYKSLAMKQGTSDVVLDGFAKAMARDPKLKAEAQARLTGYTDTVCKRDHVSKIYRDVINMALARLKNKEATQNG